MSVRGRGEFWVGTLSAELLLLDAALTCQRDLVAFPSLSFFSASSSVSLPFQPLSPHHSILPLPASFFAFSCFPTLLHVPVL